MVVAKPTDLRLDETYMKTSVILAILRGKTTVQGCFPFNRPPHFSVEKKSKSVNQCNDSVR